MHPDESAKKVSLGPWAWGPGPEAGGFLGPRALGLGPDADAAAALDADSISETLAIFERWGLRTLGDVAQLPAADLLSRLGPTGARLHQAARGEDVAPLVHSAQSPRFVERLELEWPIEGLEPLSFVLGRLTESLSMSLERADRGAVTINTRLGLVTRVQHDRTLQIPAPMRDARVLRTLIVLDLESHPPPAAIDVVEVEVGVTPGRIEQGSLLTRTLPTPEDLSTLLARLSALMGESRVGAPAVVDTHDDRAAAMQPFRVRRSGGPKVRGSEDAPSCLPEPPDPRTLGPSDPRIVLRRFRLPISARVTVEHGTPVHVSPSARDLSGGRVIACAGPWRSSGAWWAPFGIAGRSGAWHRDEWDVEVAGGVLYRLARDRHSGQWAIDAVVD